MRIRWAILFTTIAGLAVLTAAEKPPPSLEESLKKARVDGKYQMLLKQVKDADAAKEHGDFQDVGYQKRGEVAGHWVYVAPYWYVWRDRTGQPMPKRQWGPEQMIGPPDTWPNAGDVVTAWASLTEDGQDEWIALEYAEPVVPNAVIVYATYNPGAIGRVSVFKLDGEEVEVWKGQDPTPVGVAKGISVIPFRVNFKTNRVRIDLRSKEVGGWNEIDAVGLRADGKTHWAVAADASSTYASLVTQPPPVIDPDDARLDALERDVRDLKKRLERLEEKIKKRKQR